MKGKKKEGKQTEKRTRHNIWSPQNLKLTTKPSADYSNRPLIIRNNVGRYLVSFFYFSFLFFFAKTG